MEKSHIIRIVFFVAFILEYSNENPTGHLSKGLGDSKLLAITDFSKNVSGLHSQIGLYNVFQAKPSDLAIKRLKSSIIQVVELLRNMMRDSQLFGNPNKLSQGATKEVLEILTQGIQKDIFTTEQQIKRSNIANTFGSLLRQRNQNHERVRELLKKKWQKMQKIFTKIDVLYSYLEHYLINQTVLYDNILEDYARSIIEPGSNQETSLQTALAILHNLTIPERGIENPNNQMLFEEGTRDDFFYLSFLVLNNEANSNLKHLNQSPHQLVYDLYNGVALAEIKAYAMIQFSLVILKIYNRGNFILESELEQKIFEDQTTEKLMIVKGILSSISRKFWRSDPQEHIEGSTYIRMTELLQGIIENEIDMNSRKSCKESCSKYHIAETKGRCYKNLLCAKQRRCDSGRLFDCTFFDADAWVCMSNDPQRRYDWVKYEDNTTLGKKGQCINKIKVDSWWKWIFWHCSYCVCKCDQPGPTSDRYWSLKPSMSDVNQNKVVTGIRFVKKDRVIQMEIEQAVALPEGAEPENQKVFFHETSLFLKEGFMTMSYEERALDLDIVDAPEGHVVTGVKLRNLGGHINLEVQVTPISFTTGKLKPKRSAWIGNDNTPVSQEQRRQLEIVMPDVPTNFNKGFRIDSRHNEYLLFDTTSANKDVMQTTIPFIDSQEVSPSCGTWLSGIGLYHKGFIGYGGFVGALVKTFDYSPYL